MYLFYDKGLQVATYMLFFIIFKMVNFKNYKNI